MDSPKPKKIIIGTRGSALALKQADIVARVIHAAEPSFLTELRTITTYGDVDQRPVPLDTIGKGWFTKEIEDELRNGIIDIAVHSLKDVGEGASAGLMLAAYLSREDARDALITRNGEPLEKLKHGAVVGTDSPRRQLQMLALRPDLAMRSLRGNVLTRLDKLDGKAGTEPYDAIILAVAGLKRLGLDKRITRIFEPDEITPAPGQGILAIQARSDDAPVLKILAQINDADAARAAQIERSFSAMTGGGCKSPTGAYAFRDGSDCRLIGMIAREDGTHIVRGEARAPWGAADALGEVLARELLAKLGTSRGIHA